LWNGKNSDFRAVCQTHGSHLAEEATGLAEAKTFAGTRNWKSSGKSRLKGTVADFVAGTYCDALGWSCKATRGRYSLQTLANPAHWVQVADTRSKSDALSVELQGRALLQTVDQVNKWEVENGKDVTPRGPLHNTKFT
jgi:hypothetical protein